MDLLEHNRDQATVEAVTFNRRTVSKEGENVLSRERAVFHDMQDVSLITYLCT